MATSTFVETLVATNLPFVRFNLYNNETSEQWTSGVKLDTIDSVNKYVICADNTLADPVVAVDSAGVDINGDLYVSGAISGGSINVSLANPIMNDELTSISTKNVTVEATVINIGATDGRRIAFVSASGIGIGPYVFTLDGNDGNTTTDAYGADDIVYISGISGLTSIGSESLNVFVISDVTTNTFTVEQAFGTPVLVDEAYFFKVGNNDEANGAGLYVRSVSDFVSSDKTFIYNTDAWNSNQHMNLEESKIFRIGNVDKVSETLIGTSDANMTTVHARALTSNQDLSITAANGDIISSASQNSTLTAVTITSTASGTSTTTGASTTVSTTAGALTMTSVGGIVDINAATGLDIDVTSGNATIDASSIALTATAANILLQATATNKVVVNDSGVAADFQVKGSTQDYLLYVRGNNVVESLIITQMDYLSTSATSATVSVNTALTSIITGSTVTIADTGNTSFDGIFVVASTSTNSFTVNGTFAPPSIVYTGTVTLYADADAVGIGMLPTGTDYILQVTGSATATGSWTSTSDKTFKKDVVSLESTEAYNIVQKLRPVRYNWRHEEFPERKFSEDTEVGFIAQEVKELVPEVVKGDTGHMAMDYGKLVSVLVGAVQELSEKVRVLEARLV